MPWVYFVVCLNAEGWQQPMEISKPKIPKARSIVRWMAVLGFGAAFAPLAIAQGVLTVTPGRLTSTSAGTGVVGYTGDNGAATAATMASPSAVAYDKSGNLFLADRDNHVIREVVKSSGNIITIAGSGIAGFAGDGSAATTAQLDSPTGIAVDGSGNVYIADAHNNRIRKVSGGTITTIAGTGTTGFSGDGAAATSAQLSLPQGVAVDGSGNVYIADTNNHRIRKITGNTITTLAGTGDQGYAGDGGAATAALLDSPSSVAVDASGVVYVADRFNQRVRAIATSGTISTVAGNGTSSFNGDGAVATAASLSKPTGVSVGPSGAIYIADADNQRIRAVTGGYITTVAGNGLQDNTGDGGALNAASLNTPRAIATDAVGNLSIADTNNERVRAANDPTVTFASSQVGVSSTTQTITLSNSGTASLTVAAATISGPFALTSDSSCSAASVTLAAGASCTEVLAFTPTTTGIANGSIAFAGTGIAPQTVLLTGTGAIAGTSVTLSSSAAAPFINQAVTFTATVKPAGRGSATGTVTFFAGGTQLGAVQPVTNGSATLTTAFTTAGAYAITAMYSGDANFASSTSPSLAQLVGDFNFTLIPDPSQPSGVSVIPGQPAVFHFTAAPLSGPFTFPITLSATGLPPGATVTFSPNPVQLGSSSVPFTMTIQTSASTSGAKALGGGGAVLALILLPFAWRRRQRGAPMPRLMVVGFMLLSLGALTGLTGCGTNSGFFGNPTRSYNITVTATAQNAQGATLQHVAIVTLTVQ